MYRYVLIATTLLFVATGAQAAFLGQMRSAETSGMGSLNLMAGAGIFQDARSVFGTVRYGIASPIDVSGSLAIMDHDASDNIALMLGGDIQYRLTHADLGDPLDMAVGGIVEYYRLDQAGDNSLSNLGLGFNFVGSKPFKLENGFRFTPYGRLNLRVDHSHINSQSPVAPFSTIGQSDSKFHIGFNLGSVFPMSGKISLVGELQIDEQVGFLAGINFFMW
jgi:hypothetical protein